MILQEFSNWVNQKNVQTAPELAPACGFVGIAIGPDSHEAIVRVSANGYSFLLQAGRVCALRAKEYKIDRVYGNIAPAAVADPTKHLTSVGVLQVQLFESVEELDLEVARPNLSFTWKQALVTAVFPTTTRVITVPVIGRRQTHFTVSNMPGDGSLIGYRIFGRRFMTIPNNAGVQIAEALLASVAAASPVFGQSYSFYMGGLDVAENWHELALEICLLTANSTLYGDVETIGEIGAR